MVSYSKTCFKRKARWKKYKIYATEINTNNSFQAELNQRTNGVYMYIKDQRVKIPNHSPATTLSAGSLTIAGFTVLSTSPFRTTRDALGPPRT